MARKKKIKVVILGAGFSASAGIPPQGSLLREIFTIREDELSYEQATIQNDKKMLEGFLISLFGKSQTLDDISLEDIYTIIDTAIVRQRNIGIFDPSSLFTIRESLDRLISYIVNREISLDDIKHYGSKVQKIIESEDVKFISLNWDFLLERILTYLDYKIDYGVPLERTYRQSKKNKKILVLKPHGSLNWRLCPICERIYAFLDHENIFKCKNCLNIYKSHREIIDTLPSQDIRFNHRLLPLLVTPTFLKSNDIPQLNIILQSMYTVLTKAAELLFIGYSLPISDHDIRNLLIKAYSVNRDINVGVVLKSSDNPEKDTLMKHYRTIYDIPILDFQWGGF